jgi:hypothetical protein
MKIVLLSKFRKYDISDMKPLTVGYTASVLLYIWRESKGFATSVSSDLALEDGRLEFLTHLSGGVWELGCSTPTSECLHFCM